MNSFNGLKTILCLLLGIASLVGLVLSLDWPLIHDAATNHYLADQILKGKVAYRDLFDMNLPGAYLPHLFTLYLFGESDLAWRITEYLVILLASLGIWRLCKPISNHLAIISSLTWILFHLGNGAIYQGQRDWWIAVLLVLASVFLLRSLQTKKTRHEDLFFMATLIGAAAMIKPFALAFAPMAILFHLGRKQKKTNWLKTILALFLGLSLVPLVLCLWLVLSGGFDAFLDILLNYSLKIYGSIRIPNSFSSLLVYGKWVGLIVFLLGLAFGSTRKFQFKSDSVSVLFIGATYGLFHFLFQAKGWNYQAYPLFIFALPLFICALGQTQHQRRKSSLRKFATPLMALVVLLTAARGIYRTIGDESLERIKPYVPEMISDLKALDLPAGSHVQVMDTALGGLHALLRTDLQQASRTLYDFHFQVEADLPYVKNLRNEFMSDFEEKKPKVVIILEKGWLAPHDYSRHLQFPEFVEYLNSNYRLTKSRDGFRLYELL